MAPEPRSEQPCCTLYFYVCLVCTFCSTFTGIHKGERCKDSTTHVLQFTLIDNWKFHSLYPEVIAIDTVFVRHYRVHYDTTTITYVLLHCTLVVRKVGIRGQHRTSCVIQCYSIGCMHVVQYIVQTLKMSHRSKVT